MSDTLKLYHATNSPNSRRVRIFLAEKGLKPTLIPVDLGAGEQHSEAYGAINPRRVVTALVLEDGRLIEVVAAPEPLIEIRGSDPHHLIRVAWHLGNRHLPTQIMPKGLRIRRDHVIEAMVKGLGARVIEIEAPFDPEGGAYAGGAQGDAQGDHHHHDHHHDHAGHDHASHDHGGHHHHDEHGGHEHHHGHHHAHDHK